MKMIGQVRGGSFDLPLTQEEIADATGLTPVHTNRTLQRLRSEGMIELHDRILKVNDVAALRDAAGFDPTYLHIKRRLQ
jgi:CRP-like cAMP-binding protein